MNCPYKDQLGVVLADTYHLGTMNASLLATEGVASVGLILAPLVAIVCGAEGTLCSDGLPARSNLRMHNCDIAAKCSAVDYHVNRWLRPADNLMVSGTKGIV